MDDVLRSAIKKLLPKVEEPVRKVIYEKVSVHMLEYMKGLVFRGSKEEQELLEKEVAREPDIDKRSDLYGKGIARKFVSLPKNEQDRVEATYSKELTKVMHKVYKALE